MLEKKAPKQLEILMYVYSKIYTSERNNCRHIKTGNVERT